MLRNKKARSYAGFERFGGRLRNMPESKLFSDAEAREDHAQQVVGGELAGDLTYRFLGEAEFLGHQFQRVAVVEGAADAGEGFA